METFADLPIILFKDQPSWRQWLVEHHEQPTGVWLKLAKKASGKQSVSYVEALDDALCYGWIDAQKRSYDELYFLQKFCPRRPKSIWSKINVEKVAVLTTAGKMEASGIAAVEAAKLDGRWAQAYDSPSNMVMPTDFQEALNQNPKAKAFFEQLNKTNRYPYIWRVQTAKTPKTRNARIEKYIAMLNNQERFN